MKPRLELEMDETIEQKFMTSLAVFEEQLKNLTKHIDELRLDIKEIKDIQTTRIAELEKKVSILEEKVSRLNWIVNLVIGVIITGITGGLLSLILK